MLKAVLYREPYMLQKAENSTEIQQWSAEIVVHASERAANARKRFRNAEQD